MISGIFEAINGSLNEELRLSIINNNLANINVAGFKKDRLHFATMLRNQLHHMDGEVSGTGVVQDQQLYRRIVNVRADMSQGKLRHTGNPLDLAISGEGFFRISTPHGIRYTRNGIFSLNDQGMIVTQGGHFLLGGDGPISVPPGDLTVDAKGQIFVSGDLIATLKLGAFEKPEYLERDADALFRPGPLAGEEREPGKETAIEQGYLEEGNVSATEEMVKMLQTVRIYESYQKIIRALHELDNKAINDAGRFR